MKQLLSLFLFLLPCLALAQYPSNGNQKITLGEQTSADGLIYRGVLGDTLLITPSSDTSAYIILDTVNHRFYNYNRTTNVWSVAGGGTAVTTFSGGSTGLTPSDATSGAVTLGGTLAVANGGTNTSTLTANKVMVGNGTSGVLTPSNLHWNNTNSWLGVGLSNPAVPLHVRMGDDNNFALQGPVILTTGVTLNSFNDAVNTGRPMEFRASQYLYSSGKVGYGVTSPTALLHIAAGTATASTAPLKFTSGVNLTSPLGGEMEFNGTNLFFSPSTTRHTVNHGLTGSATLNFPSTLTMLSADLTITVTGATDGDVVSLGVPNAAVNANTSYSAWVSAANTVTVRFNNYSSGTVDPASALFKVFVTK